MKLLGKIPNEWRMVFILGALGVILAGVSFAGGRASSAIVISHTKTVKVSLAQQYGKPDQTIDGKQINANLDGLKCDVFQAKQVIVCHR